MYKKAATLLLAFGLVFWLSDDPAVAKKSKRYSFGQTSLINLTGGFKARRKARREARRVSETRQKITSSRIQIRISIASQSMQVTQGGRVIGNWAISSGKRGFETPRGRFRVGRMHKTYFSKKYYNAPMPNAMFFYGGVAIHGTGHVRSLGRPASHGCIRLHPSNAAKLFALVRQYGGSVQVN